MMFLAAPSAIPLKPMEIYALVNIQKDQKAIEAMAEIVDLPNLNLVIFHSYVCLPWDVWFSQSQASLDFVHVLGRGCYEFSS